MANERASHMTLVRKASCYGRLGRGFTGSQELLCKAYSSLDEVSVGCSSYFTRKAPEKLETAHARERSELGQRH